MRKFSELNLSVRELNLDLEGIPFSLHMVDQAEQLLEELLAKGDEHEDVQDERIPYWAELWPSALALGRYLIKNHYVQAGMKVTEIGCGLGLSGIVAGKLGGDVTLSDYLPDALVMAKHNWERNVEARGRFVQMDWREPDPKLAADLLLASDVAYEARAFEPLPGAFRRLCRKGGRILVSEPGRAMAKPFFESLGAQGFRCKSEVLTGSLEGLAYRVNIYELEPV